MPSKIILRYLDGKDKITLPNEVLDLAGLEIELETGRQSREVAARLKFLNGANK